MHASIFPQTEISHFHWHVTAGYYYLLGYWLTTEINRVDRSHRQRSVSHSKPNTCFVFLSSFQEAMIYANPCIRGLSKSQHRHIFCLIQNKVTSFPRATTLQIKNKLYEMRFLYWFIWKCRVQYVCETSTILSKINSQQRWTEHTGSYIADSHVPCLNQWNCVISVRG